MENSQQIKEMFLKHINEKCNNITLEDFLKNELLDSTIIFVLGNNINNQPVTIMGGKDLLFSSIFHNWQINLQEVLSLVNANIPLPKAAFGLVVLPSLNEVQIAISQIEVAANGCGYKYAF